MEDSMQTLRLVCLVTVLVHAPAIGADSLRDAAADAERCRSLDNPEVRLACFDAAAKRLAEALGSPEPTERVTDTPPPVVAPPKASEPARTSIVAEPQEQTAQQLPSWAAEPVVEEKVDRADEPRQFESSVVRITRLPDGRHRFYTDDGAVWEQTQNVEFRPPTSLPAVAEFNRKRTGNPTIKFDVSSRSYRVRRIE
jgi:hypothetical protein